MKKEVMSNERREASLSVPDLTDPKNGVHVINIIVERVQKALEKAYPETNVQELRTSPIVTVEENFDALLFPQDNSGRSSRYTRYVTEDTVLRTHTSAAIPRWLERITQEGAQDTLVTLPGICYRRDIVDRTHCPEPHQLDVWRIKRGNPQFNRPDLIDMIETILNAVVPGYEYRANEVTHPYTINGLEVEILVNDEWLEVLECGEANPTVLASAGLDTEECSGLALGMGLDRLAMVIKGIGDIRILRSEDPRIVRQMTNLEKYEPVSNQPPAKRVLSYSTSKDKTEEDVCEEIRDELGHEAHYLEEVEYSEIPYEDLPEKAKENLGIRPHQKNVVVKLIFRSPEGTLEREMVNEWMQRLYPRLNEGDKGYM